MRSSAKILLFICGLFPLSLAMFVCASAQNSASPPSASDASVPIPRMADGKPVLTGVWTDRYDSADTDFKIVGQVGHASCCQGRLGGLYTGEQDGKVVRKGDRNKPMYKPEYWEKVRSTELHSKETDTDFTGLCSSRGVPRMGPPQEIVHEGNRYVFLYAGVPETTANTFRVIPMDRPHDPKRVDQETFKGDSVGHWEGDTLVVDTIGFNDETWLTARLGYIHSNALHVIERFTRQGNTIKYEVTVEDPVMLLQPWVWSPTTMKLNPDPNAMLPEDPPCSERDEAYTEVR